MRPPAAVAVVAAGRTVPEGPGLLVKAEVAEAVVRPPVVRLVAADRAAVVVQAVALVFPRAIRRPA